MNTESTHEDAPPEHISPDISLPTDKSVSNPNDSSTGLATTSSSNPDDTSPGLTETSSSSSSNPSSVQDPAGTAPPIAHSFVRTEKDPSFWKLFTNGPLMTNAFGYINPFPRRQRRYRVLYPPNYRDVYLHKAPWKRTSESLPDYHVELYHRRNRHRYELEPIVILGPHDYSATASARHLEKAKALAVDHMPFVIDRVLRHYNKMMDSTEFVRDRFWEMGKDGWGRRSETTRREIDAKVARVTRFNHTTRLLVDGLGNFLIFVGERQHAQDMVLLKRGVVQARDALDRLRIGTYVSG
jgi:hypothetical protein